MRVSRRRLGSVLLAIAMLSTLSVPPRDASAAGSPSSVAEAASQAYAPADQSAQQPVPPPFEASCPDAPAGFARCFSAVKVAPSGGRGLAPSPQGYGPTQYRGAYNLNGASSPNNAIVAIVDAFDNPNAKADLDTYSTTYGIPVLPTCTVAIVSSTVPCFQKVDQNGGTSYPSYNAGWAGEIALDVQAAHAICQNCRILLVEAADNSYT